MKRTKINKKRPGLAIFFKKNRRNLRSRYYNYVKVTLINLLQNKLQLFGRSRFAPMSIKTNSDFEGISCKQWRNFVGQYFSIGVGSSVTRLDNILDFGQLFNAFGNN